IYDSASDFSVDMETEWFQCAAWYRAIGDRVPNLRLRTLEDLLLGEYTDCYKQQWQRQIISRYKVNSAIADKLLSSQPFNVCYRTLTNDFRGLSKLTEPLLEKSESARGKYRKVDLSKVPVESDNRASDTAELPVEEVLPLLNEDLSAIAELLLTKIRGSQRLFIHTEYIVKEDLQDTSADWADRLKELWKQPEITPISFIYNSASKRTKSHCIVYPVCLYYHQRAYYLCAFGQSPHSESGLSWHNYRLERISKLEELSWDDSEITRELSHEIYDRQGKIESHLGEVMYEYTPEYIQEQLEIAYGFDFYRPEATMLLRFNRDFDRRYIKDTIRHETFTAIDSDAAKDLIAYGIKNEDVQADLKNKVQMAQDDAYYTLNYRVDDNNVIMRLRAWGHNVEVFMPLDLRQRMRDDMEQNWRLYESDR
ncbi:MAG: TIGR03985 family CRISPR-associated protein, partial [Cyanobacteria bacterium J06629_2]